MGDFAPSSPVSLTPHPMPFTDKNATSLVTYMAWSSTPWALELVDYLQIGKGEWQRGFLGREGGGRERERERIHDLSWMVCYVSRSVHKLCSRTSLLMHALAYLQLVSDAERPAREDLVIEFLLK